MSDWEIIGPAPKQNVASDWEIIGPASQKETPWYESPLISGAVGFNKRVEDVTHGIMQPLLESGYLGERIKRGSEESGRRSQEGYEEALRRHPAATTAGNILGGTAISLPAAAATGGGAAFSRAPGFLKYLKTILGGATAGGTTGAAQYVNPGESRAGNAFTGALAGSGLGILGAGGSAAYNAISRAGKAFPAKKVAQGVLEKAANVEKQYQTGYRNLFKEAKDSGVRVNIPKVKERPILEEMTKKESKFVRGFLNPGSHLYGNPKAGHQAASDLGKTIRRLEKRKEGIVGLNSAERKALESARSAQKKIRSSLGEGFDAAGRPDLAKTYAELTSGFGRDVIPYRTTSAINKYKKGELKDNDFLKALMADKKFQAKLSAEHPELKTRKNLQNAVKYGIPSAGGLGYLANKFGAFE